MTEPLLHTKCIKLRYFRIIMNNYWIICTEHCSDVDRDAGSEVLCLEVDRAEGYQEEAEGGEESGGKMVGKVSLKCQFGFNYTIALILVNIPANNHKLK